MKALYLFLLIFFSVDFSLAFEPITSTMVVGGAASSALAMLLEYTGVTSVRCMLGMVECCNKAYIKENITGLMHDMDSSLYGQHLVKNTIVRALKGHFFDKQPVKPLVMSFHGCTGCGKNYVARMIINNIYKKKTRSSFVNIFNAELDFKHAHLTAQYKDQLQAWLHGNVSRCGRSIFIFDEVDHMPEGLLDSLKPYLGTEPSVHGVDYRKSIFIFLGNTGGGKIAKTAQDAWQMGRSREQLKLAEMQNILQMSAYNEKNGLRKSGIIEKNLIDHFVPFLPLERIHVRLCIKDEIRRIGKTSFLTKSNIEKVMDELQWFPEDSRLYSTSGCKKIAQKVSLIIHE